MSVSLYRWTEACDGKPCVGDCDKCNFNLMSDDHSCPNCYYEGFDENAFPCSRCVHNAPKRNMFRPKMECGDLISRQDALDALEWNWAGKRAIDAIKNLPSAHCTDCPLKGVI